MKGHVIDHLSVSTADIQSDDPDDSLSLRDLPLSSAVDHTRTSTSSVNHSRRSSPDFFEFLVNRDNDDDHHVTSPADDVISDGRLLPFNPPPLPRRSFSLSSISTRAAVLRRDSPLIGESLRREILPSRSLDCRKIRRSSNKTEAFSRNSSNRSGIIHSEPKTTPPPWYFLVLGLPARVIPSEMELKDIKSRQLRKNIPPTRFFSGKSERFSGDRSSSWKLLSVLSCKSHASVDVMKTTSFHDQSVRNM